MGDQLGRRSESTATPAPPPAVRLTRSARKEFARRAAMRKMAHRSGIALGRYGDPGTTTWRATALTLDKKQDMTDELDGTLAGMRQFLREMVDLAEQTERTHAAPVLELQFGVIGTRTSVTAPASLTIVAQLPPSAQLPYHSWPPLALKTTAQGTTELLWQADRGCYVAIRTLPITGFSDAASVFDAIMALADEAQAGYAAASATAAAPGHAD